VFLVGLLVVVFVLRSGKSMQVPSNSRIFGPVSPLAGYSVVSIAAYWTIERVAAFFHRLKFS
jgi:hypothetical protein